MKDQPEGRAGLSPSAPQLRRLLSSSQCTAGHYRGVPPHWVNEPHQELTPAVLEVAGSFFPPTPPRAPPSQVDGMTSSQMSLAGPPYGADIQHYVPPLLLAGWRAPPTALFFSPAPPAPAPPPALCVPTRPSLGMISSSSFSLVIITLRSAVACVLLWS